MAEVVIRVAVVTVDELRKLLGDELRKLGLVEEPDEEEDDDA